MIKEGVLFEKLPDNKVKCHRIGFRVSKVRINDGKCPECGESIAIVES